MISLSLSNLIKNFLNIQDDNISFPEEEYCQVTQKGDYRIKVFKGFLNKESWMIVILTLKLIENIYQKLFVLMNLSLLKILS